MTKRRCLPKTSVAPKPKSASSGRTEVAPCPKATSLTAVSVLSSPPSVQPSERVTSGVFPEWSVQTVAEPSDSVVDFPLCVVHSARYRRVRYGQAKPNGDHRNLPYFRRPSIYVDGAVDRMDFHRHRLLRRRFGWTLKYFQLGISGALSGEKVDTTEVWNSFLNPGQVIFFQFIVILLVLGTIWKGKAIEGELLPHDFSVCPLLTLFLSLWMDLSDGSLDGALFMFTVDFDVLFEPEVWINGLSQSAWSCSAGMGMCITYAVYMSKDEDTVLNVHVGLANNSISIIAGLAVLSAIFAVTRPLGHGDRWFLRHHLPRLARGVCSGSGWRHGPLIMTAMFFLALSFAALTSMISTVELCVRNFVDHGYDRERSVLITGLAIFIFGLPSAIMWIKLDSAGVAFPEFLEVQDHIWGYGLMFSGLFIAFSIWKYGYMKWRAAVEEGTAAPGFAGYLGLGVSAFRDDFINTGDNDLEVGRWWDVLIYIAFPILFFVLMASYFSDMIANTPNVWDPSNPKALTIILLFWGVVAALFIGLNKKLIDARSSKTCQKVLMRIFPSCRWL